MEFKHTWVDRLVPSWCNHCGSAMGGFMAAEVRCSSCEYLCHKGCEDKVVISCRNPQPATVPAKKLSEIETTKPVDKEGFHMFDYATYTVPTYCNWCRQLLVGVSNQGLSCVRCGLCLHEVCLAPFGHQKTCRTAFVTDEGEHKDHHHWVEGNCWVNCSVCSKSLVEPQFLWGVTCAWCKVGVHNHEKADFDKKEPFCNFGKFKQFVVPPSHFILQKDGTFQVKKTDNLKPLLVFINKKSGGQQGSGLIAALQKNLNPLQVFDLSDGGPKKGLEMFRHIPNCIILACGGDGTVGWVLNVLDTTNLPVNPPVAVLPLGTGNDLARTLQFGPGYEGESIEKIIEDLLTAHVMKLDRWEFQIAVKDLKAGTFPPLAISQQHSVINNYFSIGVDAQVALRFHLEREANPDKFKSRTGNKLMYGQFGMEVYMQNVPQLVDVITMEIDGKPYEIPKDLQGIMVINLPNYAGGSNLWGNTPDKPISINDKKLEIVGVQSAFHMGQCKTGLASAIQICQCSSISFNWIKDSGISVQVDGEPWLQDPCKIHIQLLNQANMLCAKDTILIP